MKKLIAVVATLFMFVGLTFFASPEAGAATLVYQTRYQVYGESGNNTFYDINAWAYDDGTIVTQVDLYSANTRTLMGTVAWFHSDDWVIPAWASSGDATHTGWLEFCPNFPTSAFPNYRYLGQTPFATGVYSAGFIANDPSGNIIGGPDGTASIFDSRVNFTLIFYDYYYEFGTVHCNVVSLA